MFRNNGLLHAHHERSHQDQLALLFERHEVSPAPKPALGHPQPDCVVPQRQIVPRLKRCDDTLRVHRVHEAPQKAVLLHVQDEPGEHSHDLRVAHPEQKFGEDDLPLGPLEVHEITPRVKAHLGLVREMDAQEPLHLGELRRQRPPLAKRLVHHAHAELFHHAVLKHDFVPGAARGPPHGRPRVKVQPQKMVQLRLNVQRRLARAVVAEILRVEPRTGRIHEVPRVAELREAPRRRVHVDQAVHAVAYVARVARAAARRSRDEPA